MNLCPKCLKNDSEKISSCNKYKCKNCNYEFLFLNKENFCTKCNTNTLVTIKEYYTSYNGKYPNGKMCILCKEEK